VEVVNVNADGEAKTNTIFTWNPRDNGFYFKKNSYVFEKICKKFGKTIEELHKEFECRAKLLYELQKRNLSDFNQIQKIINEYHKNPPAVLNAFGIKTS
jgi:hypothetical protein